MLPSAWEVEAAFDVVDAFLRGGGRAAGLVCLNDRIALGTLAELFPRRAVVGIHAVDLVWGFGTLHCLTQQEPSSTVSV